MEGKRAIVSGAAKGIGRASAIRMAKEKCRLLLVDLAGKDGNITADLQETIDIIKGMDVEVNYVFADVSKSADIDKIVNAAVDMYGGIDICINLAGVGLVNTLDDATEELWDWTVDINMKGIFLICKAVAAVFKKQGTGGKIVNAASIAGVTGSDNLFDYNASKAGVISLTQSFARHLGPYGVNVNAVCPGFVMTSMWEETDRRLFKIEYPGEEYEYKRMHNASINKQCLKRDTLPEHIADGICFLCSDQASEITGQYLNIDGGYEFH